ncbi:MAG: hypothetical protein RI924_51 [Bacteroidota bacterium]|jgi:phosphoribosylanthranilate isomerase
MQVKVCGLTELAQVQELDAIGVQMAGFIFHRGSPRCVLSGKLSAQDLKSAPLGLKKVGVFVNSTEDEILTQIDAFGLNLVQLHGEESPEFCARLNGQIPVIKAIAPKPGCNLSDLTEEFQEHVDYFLFDNQSATQQGGTGEKFDWSLMELLALKKPFLLSGGIAPQDADTLKHWRLPIKPWAVDLNSRFETHPGRKNIIQIEQFINDLKS